MRLKTQNNTDADEMRRQRKRESEWQKQERNDEYEKIVIMLFSMQIHRNGWIGWP